jgi:hypothetical protein
MDCRICQTFTASPAEPGDLPKESAVKRSNQQTWRTILGRESFLEVVASLCSLQTTAEGIEISGGNGCLIEALAMGVSSIGLEIRELP